MKKLFGVIVAVVMCLCLAVPCFAVNENTTASSGSSLGDLAAMLENGGASLDELNELLQNEDLMAAFEDSDIAALFGDASNGDTDALSEIQQSISEFEQNATIPEDVTMPEDVAQAVTKVSDALTTTAQDAQADTVDTTAASASVLEAIFAPLSSVMDVAPFEEMLSGASNSDVTSILSLVASVLGSEGIDFSAFTSSDVGQFDIANLLAPAGSNNGSIANLAESATDVTAGLADTLVSGLEALGLDTKTIEGLLDNEIVNFFANMYIGFIGKTEEAPVETTAPPVVTTTTPKTGDTSAVFVAIATLFVAGTAAGVCLKKKEEA